MKIKLRDYQLDAIDTIEASLAFGSDNIILSAETSFGKEQPYSELIPTVDGMKKMNQLKVNDYVIGSDGKKTKITDITEQGYKDIYEIEFNRSDTVRCGGDHLWTFYTVHYYRKNGKSVKEKIYHTMTTRDIIKNGMLSNSLNLPKIDLSIPVDYNGKYGNDDIPIDPFLYGMFLSLGSYLSASNDFRIITSVKDTEMLIKSTLKNNNVEYDSYTRISRGNRECIFIIRENNNIFKKLIELDLMKHKKDRIMLDIYLDNNYKNRFKLLSSLSIFSSSNKTTRTRKYLYVEFASKKLIDCVSKLAVSLGYRTLKITKKKREKYYSYFSTISHVTKYSRITGIRKTNKKELCRCITVDAKDSLYMTSKFIATHNSITIAGLCERLRGRKLSIIVNIESLIDQIAFFLKSLDIDYSILKSGRENEFNPNSDIKLIMSQTMYARKELNIESDIAIIDERHIEYKTPRTNDILSRLSPSAIIGMTATPYDRYGFKLENSDVIETISCNELTERGYLAPIKYYTTNYSENVELDKIKVNAGDYNLSELTEKMTERKALNNIIDSALKFRLQNKKTIIFCSTIDECNIIAEELRKHDFDAYAYHSKISKKDNEAILNAFKNNEEFFLEEDNETSLFENNEKRKIKCLVSVDKLTTGFSVDDIDFGINNRPTKIRSLWQQIAGRLRRKSDSLTNILNSIDTSKKTALVCSFYNEINEIKKQLKSKNIENIDVYKYNKEPNGYENIIYNVRPDKQFGHMIDLGQCLSYHGFPENKYTPPEKTGDKIIDTQNITRARKELSLKYLKFIIDKQVYEVTDKKYKKAVNSLLSNDKKLTQMRENELYARLDMTDNVVEMIAILFVLMDRKYSSHQINEYGKDVKGYISNNGKLVYNFMNQNKISWVSDYWLERLENEDDYYVNKYKKALKKNIKNIIRDKKNIYSIRFFIDFLLEQDATEKLLLNEKNNNIDINENEYEVIIDEDVPF